MTNEDKIEYDQGEGWCPNCKKKSSFLKLAYWTDKTYKCPSCFKSVDIIRYPQELIVIGKCYHTNRPKIVIVLDGLYIAGAQKHCLFLIDVFRDLGFDSIVISTEGGGLWVDMFIKKSTCIIISNSQLCLTWSSVIKIFSKKVLENVLFLSTHLVGPTIWAIDNVPGKYLIYSNLHSEPSEHEVFTQEILRKITRRSKKIIFPSLGTLEQYVSYSVEFQLNKEKLLVLDNCLYNPKFKIIRKKNMDLINIAVISRIDEDKFSIPLFVETIKILRKKINNIKIKVAGNGELYDELKFNIKNEQLSDIISLEGFIIDVSNIYNWATLVFLPSKRESMPYVMIEAISYNLPIVLPKCGYTVYAKKMDYIYSYEIGIAKDAANKILQAVNEYKRHNITNKRKLDNLVWIDQINQCYFKDYV